MPRATLSLACLLWLTLIGAAGAQSSLNTNDPGVASLQNFSGGVSFAGSYFQVQNVAGNGVGWRNGFTQFGMLTPFWINNDLVAAFNGRVMVTDTQDIGGNIGGFLRWYSEDLDRIFGANGYYDLDKTYLNNHFRQGGFGVESLGQWWDFRANGYIPTQSGNRFIQAVGLAQDPFFFGNRIGFLGLAEYEQSLYGGDFEFGIPVLPQTPWLRAYAGMYFYAGNGKGKDPIGVRGRVEGWVADDLNVGMMVTEDDQFGTNLNVVVNFLFSGWRPTRWFPNFTTRERMLIPVQRNWRIAASQYIDKVYVPAINPRTNQPYFVTWVDDSNPLPGNGTFENPFSAMPGSSPQADLILVREGNTSALNPLASSIQLTDFQRMLGEGRAHQFDAYANFGPYSVPLQTFTLPGFTDSGNYPWLTSLTNTITLANNNEVSAFNLVGANGAAITNTILGSNNFNLNHLNLSQNIGGGINLTQATGAGLINNVNALNNVAGGIVINSGGAPLNLDIRDVTSNSTALGIQTVGISLDADNSPIVASFTNVTTNNNDGNGIALTESAGLTATLNNVASTGNLGAGLRADGVGSFLNLALTQVDTSNNTDRGIYVTGNGANVVFSATNLTDNSNGLDNINFTLTNGSTLVGSLQDVHFDNSVSGSGIVVSADNSTVGTLANPFLIQNVTADGNFLNGLSLIAANGASQVVSVVDGSFSGNGVDGIATSLSGGSAIYLSVDPTTIDGNTRDGFHFEVQDGSILTALFDQDTLNDNDRSAVFGNVDLVGTGSSIVSLTMTNTTGLRSGADGMFISSNQGANITVSVTDGDFSNSGRTTAGSSAVRFDAIDSTVDLTLTRTPGQNTAAYPAGTQEFGLQLNLNNTLFTGAVTDGNFSNNLQDGIRAIATNFSNATLTLNNVPVNGNGIDGMHLRASNGSDVNVTASNSTFSNNGLALTGAGQGLDLGVDGTAAAASLTVTLSDTAVNLNEKEGILGTATGTAANAGRLVIDSQSGTTINSNGLTTASSGVELINTAGVIQATFTDNDISFNGNRGVGYTGAGLGASDSSLTFINTGISGTTDQNVGDGLYFNVASGNRLNIDAEFVSFSGNGGRGVNGSVDGAGSSVTIDRFLLVTADGNGLEGMKLAVTNSGALNGNINGGSFSNNGQTAASDGVNVAVDTNGVAIICFDGTTVDSNPDDGFDFSVKNGGTLNVALQTSGTYGTLSASNNLDQAVVFDVAAGSTGNLFMDGPNVFNGNQSATAAISYVANGATQAAFSFSGTSDGNTGDAINVQMTNVADAYIDIHGPGSLSNNGSNAVDIALNTVTFGAAPLAIAFPQGNFTANPFNISDLTMATNGDEAIKVVGANVTMANGTISGNTVTDSGQNGAGNGILLDFTGGGNNIASLTLDGNISDRNQGNGISIVAVNSTFGTLTIENGGMHANAGHGLNLNLDNTPITTLNITGNRQGTNQLIGLGFLISGDTFSQPFSIENTSIASVDITNFTFDLTPLPGGQFNFDTDSPPVVTASAATPFAPFGGTEVTTGLQTVNGSTNPPGWAIPDQAQVMNATFNNFGPGKTFQWVVDLDQTFGGDESVSGNELIGANVSVNFSNGANLTGGLFAVPGDPTASQFIATGGTLTGPGISSNHGDGVHIEQRNGSNITNLNITDNEIDANDGSDGAGPIPGHGINFAVVSNSRLVNVNISGNDILQNTGDGVRLVDPNLPALNKTLNLTMNDNTIDQNSANGVNLQISNGETLNLSMAGNTIGTAGNGNGGMGVRAVISNASSFNGTIGDNTKNANVFTANRDAGFGLVMSNSATGSLTVINSQFNNSVDGADATFAGVGLGVVLADSAQLSPVHIGDATAQNTAFNGNAADGLLIDLFNTAPKIVNQMQLLNVQANDNGGNGSTIRLRNTTSIGDGVGGAVDLLVQGTVAGAEMSGNAGNGLRIERYDSAILPEVHITGMTFNENVGDGVSLFHTGDSTLTNYLVDFNTFSGNANGLSLTQNASARTVVDINRNTFTDNRDNGILISLNQAAALGDPVAGTASRIDGNTFARNGNADGEAAINVQVNAGDNVTNDAYVELNITGDLARQTFDGDRNGIIINNNSSYFNPAPPAGVVSRNTFVIQGADIANSVNNGITLVNTGINGLNRTGDFFIGDPAAGKDVTVSNFGGDGIAFGGVSANVTVDHVTITHPIGTTGGDDGIAATLGGNVTLTIQDATILRSGGDGISIREEAGNFFFPNTVNIFRTTSNENVGRGLLVDIQHDGLGSGPAFPDSVYNIGSLSGGRNSFSSNGLQGIVFVQRSATSSANRIFAQDIQINPGALPLRDTSSPDLLQVRAFFLNNDINANGTLGLATGDIDGAVFAVGSNTRLSMNYSGNAHAGNTGDDFRIFSIASAEMAASVNNTPDNNPPQAGDGVDEFQQDAVAHIDLIFGGDRDSSNTPGIPNPGPFNSGEQITGGGESSIAAYAILPGVNTLFQNGDVFKSANRSVLLRGQVQISGSLNSNVFTQNSVTQNINSFFSTFLDLDNAQLFPDPGVPGPP